MALFKRLFGGAPSSARDFYEEGLACEKQARHEAALANFSEAIRLDPEFADAVYARAFVHEITGDVEGAIADFQRVIELNPTVGDELVGECGGDGSARVVRLKRNVTLEEGMIEYAVAWDIVRVYHNRGTQRVDVGDYDNAIADFSQALDRSPFGDEPDQPWEAQPHPAVLYFERGRCYRHLGRFQEAVADLHKAADFKPPEQQFRHHLYLLLGQCHGDLENYDSAIATLTQAIHDSPHSAEAYGARAHAHHGKGELDQALADISEAIRLVPQCADVFVIRSLWNAEKHRFVEAIADASEAIRLAPQPWEQWAPYISRANIYQQTGEYQKAVADYTQAIRLDPDNPNTYQERAKAYRALGDQESASQDERSAQAVTNLQETLADLQQGNWNKALPVLEQVVELDPKLHRAYVRRGMAYLSRQEAEPDRAIADFSYVIDKLPKPTLDWGPVFGAYVDAFVWRGDACMRKGEFHKAIADFTEALRLQPKLIPVYGQRAQAYRAIGETEKAMKDEQTAQQLQG